MVLRSARLGRDNRLADDFAKFLALGEKRLNTRWLEQLCHDDEVKPDAGLAQFLQHDAEFVNEMVAAFRGTRLLVIRRPSRPCTDQLSRHVAPQAVGGQRNRELSHSDGKAQ